MFYFKIEIKGERSELFQFLCKIENKINFNTNDKEQMWRKFFC